jgi:drug/metabolite transporter (DMT)-like permease
MNDQQLMTDHPFPRTPPITPIIPLIVGMAAISLAPILVKYSHAPASIQGMYRMLFTVLLMLPFGRSQLPAVRSVRPKDWVLLALAGFFLGLHFLWWMMSMDLTSIASSTIILSMEPVLVMIGSFWIFRDKPSNMGVAGLIVAFAGILLVGSGDLGVSGSAVAGDLYAFLSVMSIAVNMLIAKRVLERVSSYLYSLTVFAVAFCFFALYNTLSGTPLTDYPPREWLLFLLLAVVPTVLGHMIFNWLLAYVSATTISMSVFAEPVGASLLGIVLFKEMLNVFQLIGGALAIAGLFLYLKAGSRNP